MGIEARKERERAERRSGILRAAMEIYREDGYHGTTMEKIAQRAELSRATLYLHFGTKDEIFVHAIVDFLTYFGDLIEDLYQRRLAVGQRLLSDLWDRFLQFYRRDPLIFDASLYFHQGEMIRNLSAELKLLLDRAGSRNYQILCRIMSHGVEQGHFRPAPPQTLAEVVWTAFLGIVHLENSKKAMQRKGHLDSTCALAREILLKGILTDGGEDL